jgi:hypothetical protein
MPGFIGKNPMLLMGTANKLITSPFRGHQLWYELLMYLLAPFLRNKPNFYLLDTFYQRFSRNALTHDHLVIETMRSGEPQGQWRVTA